MNNNTEINPKVRFKNKVFWTMFIPAVAVFVNALAAALGLDWSKQVEDGVNVAMAVLSMLALAGVIIDPTTPGIGDSDKALTYNKPSDSNIASGQVLKEFKNGDEVPFEYDETEMVEADFNNGGGSTIELSPEEMDLSEDKALLNERGE